MPPPVPLLAGGAAQLPRLLHRRPLRHAALPLVFPLLTLLLCDLLRRVCLQIDLLANKGVSATDIKKLKDFGLHTVADIQHTTTKNLLNIKGLSEAKVQKIKDVAKAECGNAFMTGSELKQKRGNILKARCRCHYSCSCRCCSYYRYHCLPSPMLCSRSCLCYLAASIASGTSAAGAAVAASNVLLSLLAHAD